MYNFQSFYAPYTFAFSGCRAFCACFATLKRHRLPGYTAHKSLLPLHAATPYLCRKRAAAAASRKGALPRRLPAAWQGTANLSRAAKHSAHVRAAKRC
ncbi:hypothetical protein NPIL_611041 [Nephila pilipes]|uniref:Uncharacterized protein n=1 Tax=Nephila pilipes TaxID=299642 RepID=A0A8X6UI80_NEPPI|nr:hypothetical protein NPIL_611041 [Nephila pilipes]